VLPLAAAVLLVAGGCGTRAAGGGPGRPWALAASPSYAAQLAGIALPAGPGEDAEGTGRFNTEAYARIYENPFLVASRNPLSTFSIDVARDVKIQVELNPARVRAYRLIGYENRLLRAEDFNDDSKDAGEIGAGHSVTALYEVVPAGGHASLPGVDPLRYQEQPRLSSRASTGEMLTLKLRYQEPRGGASRLLVRTVTDEGQGLAGASESLRFSAAVAAFGLLLRGSEHRGSASFGMVNDLAGGALGQDPHGDRAELLSLVRRAASLAGAQEPLRASLSLRAAP
jgi:hypothetical protein